MTDPDRRANAQSRPMPPSNSTRPAVGGGSGSRVTLEDVLEAGTQNLRISLDLAGDGDLDFEALDEAVSTARSTLVAPEVFFSASEASSAVAAEREGGTGLVSNEFQCLVSLLEAGTSPPDFVNEAQSALERASIILHEAHQAIGFDTHKHGREVDVILRSADTVDVERFARDAIKDLSADLPHHVFDAWMPSILTTVRRATTSPSDWLAEIAVTSSEYAREALWPFIINDLLVNLKGRTHPLDAGVHEIGPLAMGQAIDRLSQLPSIGRSVLAPGMFSLSQTFAHDLLLRLMNGPPRHVVGPVLLSAFKQELPTDPGVSYCLFAARQYDDSIGWLLSEQMKNVDSYVSDEVQRSAAWVLMSALEQLHGERRGEVWIPASIEWLGSRNVALDSDVQLSSTRVLMERIVSERQGLRKAWSRDCRRAAQYALRSGGLR